MDCLWRSSYQEGRVEFSLADLTLQVEPVLLPVVMDSRQGVTYVTILPQPMVELLVKDQTVRFWPVTVVPVLV
jgi:hypothetical protein